MWSSTLPSEPRPMRGRQGFWLCGVVLVLLLQAGGAQGQEAADNATSGEDEQEHNATAFALPAVDLDLPLKARNPFTSPRAQTQLQAQASQEAGQVSVRFDGSTPAATFQGDPRLIPRIKVVGLLDYGDSIRVLVELENRGRVVLREHEQIYIKDGKSNKDDALWFTVQRISHKGMTLQLKNGMIVEGHFF